MALPRPEAALLQQTPVTGDLAKTTTTLNPALVPAEPVAEGAGTEAMAKKCVDGKPNCGLLHDTMSLEWGKCRDLVDELKAEMKTNADRHNGILVNLNDEKSINGQAKKDDMEMLAESVASINTATEERNQKDQ